MACQIGIKLLVKKETKDKPWFKYEEDKNFILVLESPLKRIYSYNIFAVAKDVANSLNKGLNKEYEVGNVFFATKNNGITRVEINPTNKQLEVLNSKDAEEAEKIRQESIAEHPELFFKEQTIAEIDIENSEILRQEQENRDLTQYQNLTKESDENFIASEKTIRDLAARLSDRIGIPFMFESDRTKEYKGKLDFQPKSFGKENVNYSSSEQVAVINLAYATLDTPIHEILGHPIIRAIKNKQNVTKRFLGNFNEKFFNNQDEKIDTGKTVTHEGHTYKVYKLKKYSNIDYYAYNFERHEQIELSEKEFNDIVNESQLYKNLLKELETGKGKEVLNRVKRDYTYKELVGSTYYTQKDDIYIKNNGFGKVEHISREQFYKEAGYTLEEQQEEAIVELLGLMTAGKLDEVKDGKLISLLKRLLKEMKQFIRSLINQKEVEIDKLPDNMTLGDLSDLLAYSNSKLILPGNEVIYTTPDNQTFKTYQEASNHISNLAKSVKDVDLEGIKIEKKTVVGKIDPITGKKIKSAKFNKGSGSYFSPDENQYEPGEPDTFDLVFEDGTKNTVYDEDLYRNQSDEIQMFYSQIRPFDNTIEKFIEKNKEYEQSKEILEEWKKVNNIQYNPEEIYSRGQEFSSVVGAYSDFDVNLMMQNLLQHIEDNEKAGGKFAISAYTKPIDGKIGHLEGGGGKIKFKIYPQSQDILWASNQDVYSGSVWDASKKINKDKKSELLGVSYTKYPSLNNVNAVQPNLSSVIDNLQHHHNELGIALTGNNFRLEYDENIPSSTKKIINSLNSILDQKYGKVVKPEINNATKEKVTKFQVKGEPNIFNTREEAQALANKLSQIDYMSTYVVTTIQVDKTSGIQPTQTNETLKESIENIKNKLKGSVTDEYGTEYKLTGVPVTQFPNNKIGDVIKLKGYDYKIIAQTVEQEDWDGSIEPKMWKIEFVKIDSKKEYTSQALINTKIAKLKEVAKKYPRSLIRSEVVRTREYYPGEFSGFAEDELPFQKLSSSSVIKPIQEAPPKVSKSNQTELFQIEQQKSRLKEKSLVDRVNVLLGDYIKANNIKVEFLDKVLSKDGKEVVAKYDSIKRIIQINSNQASALTLPEELAHDLTLALGIDHVLVKRALNLIGRLDYKGILGQQYVDAYKGDVNLLKMELLGKLISKQIADPRLPDELKSENGVKIWETIKNAIKAFISLFKPNSNITSELDNIVSELSEMIVTGKVVSNPTLALEMYDMNNIVHEIKKGFPMQNFNNQKLASREKTFTLRTQNYPSGLYKFGNIYYNVSNLYGKAVKSSEIKNADYLKKKFVGEEDVRFDHVKAFFDGTEPLYVYQFSRVDESLQNLLTEQAKTGGLSQDIESFYVYYKREAKQLRNQLKKLNAPLSDESKFIEGKIEEIEATLMNLKENNNKQNLINLANKTIDDIDIETKALYNLEEKGIKPNVKNIEKSIKALHVFEDLDGVGERARQLIKDLKKFTIQFLQEEHLRLTGRTLTEEQMGKITEDVSGLESGFGTLADVENYLAKTIGLMIKEKQSIIEKNNKKSFKLIAEAVTKLEDFQKSRGITGKNIYNIFIQEHRGSTVLTKPYTSEYYKLISDSYEKEDGDQIRRGLSTFNERTDLWEPKNSIYFNQNFKEINKRGNEPLLEFYNFFKDTVASVTDELPVDLDKEFIPNSVESTIFDVLRSDKDSMGKLKDGINHIMSANFWDEKEIGYFINRDLEKDEVPLKYIGNLPANKKSSDLGEVLLKFVYFGNSYKEMSDVLPKTKLLQEILEEKAFIVGGKRDKGKNTNLNKMVEGFINMQVKGEMKSEKDWIGNNTADAIDFALKYTSLLRIGFNPFAAAANFTIGGIGNIIESIGGRYFTTKNLVDANSIFFSQKSNENSKLSKITEQINPLMEMDDHGNLEKIKIGTKNLLQKIVPAAYSFQRIAENKLQITTMIAIMLKNKVTTKSGEVISTWEAFDDNGVWNEDLMGYKFEDIDLNKLTNKVQRVNQMIHGRYSSKDASILAQQSLFRAAFQFKKWIPAAIESRFGGERFDDRLDSDIRGRYRTYAKAFKYMSAKLRGDIESLKNNKFDEVDSYNMRKNATELIILTALLLLKAGFDDKELRRKPSYKFGLRLLNQVSADLLFFYSPLDMQHSFTSVPIEKTLTDVSKVIRYAPFMFSGEKKYNYRSGDYKGENKGVVAIKNVIPGGKQVFDVYRLGNNSPGRK